MSEPESPREVSQFYTLPSSLKSPIPSKISNIPLPCHVPTKPNQESYFGREKIQTTVLQQKILPIQEEDVEEDPQPIPLDVPDEVPHALGQPELNANDWLKRKIQILEELNKEEDEMLEQQKNPTKKTRFTLNHKKDALLYQDVPTIEKEINEAEVSKKEIHVSKQVDKKWLENQQKAPDAHIFLNPDEYEDRIFPKVGIQNEKYLKSIFEKQYTPSLDLEFQFVDYL